MPHLLYLAIGFPPAAKSGAYRMRATANLFAELGWDVTVLTIDRRAWDREYGTDPTLEALVDPRVRQVELPLARVDLDPDIRSYGWVRARYPERWLRARRRLDLLSFPEPVFGSWRRTLERGAAAVHAERPVDLVLVSPSPYTMLAAAWHLHERHRVPFAIDYRDAWSLDVLAGTPAFEPGSRAGRWERRLVEAALAVWTVNEPIQQFYRERYPQHAAKFVVARNGFDADLPSSPPAPTGPPEDGAAGSPEAGTPVKSDPGTGHRPLRIGYLGTVNLYPAQMQAIVDGWIQARAQEPLLADARLEFRGHLGAGIAKASNANAQILTRAAEHGVSYGGPVAKAEVAEVYRSWDGLLLALAGGKYVTSGKIFEYLSTGLPVISAHEPEHAAADLLRSYPLWAATEGLAPEQLARAFARGAQLARAAGPAERAEALRYAAQFERRLQLMPAVRALVEQVTGTAPPPEPPLQPTATGPAAAPTAEAKGAQA